VKPRRSIRTGRLYQASTALESVSRTRRKEQPRAGVLTQHQAPLWAQQSGDARALTGFRTRATLFGARVVSSVGRAVVSKTTGRRFEPCTARQEHRLARCSFTFALLVIWWIYRQAAAIVLFYGLLMRFNAKLLSSWYYQVKMNARALQNLNFKSTVRSFARRGSLLEARNETFIREKKKKIFQSVLASQYPNGATREQYARLKKAIDGLTSDHDYGIDTEISLELVLKSNALIRKTQTQLALLHRFAALSLNAATVSVSKFFDGLGLAKSAATVVAAPATAPTDSPLEQRPQIQATAPTV
jgi:hypothetical protein